MQQLLNWMRRLVYPAAIILLLWAGYQVIASPYISESNGKILAVYDGDSTVQNCIEEETVTPDKENVSEEALARAGETLDRAFRDRRDHAEARLDAALHAADRDR